MTNKIENEISEYLANNFAHDPEQLLRIARSEILILREELSVQLNLTAAIEKQLNWQ